MLSLVFYLQMISDYIPRGFSKIPILTLFTLTNFSFVFLSCVMTVFVLRLYHKPIASLSTSYNEMPYIFRLILFKYIAPLMLLKFYFRARNEVYTREHIENYHSHNKKKFKKSFKQKQKVQYNTPGKYKYSSLSGSSALSLKKAPSMEGASIFTSSLFHLPTTQSRLQ